MGRLGFYYDQRTCIGCGACQVACTDKNDLETACLFRRVGTLPVEGLARHYSGGCNHCGNPACVEACPTGAMHTNEDGTVGHDSGRCIGCASCVWACPYGAVSLSRISGTARKCDSCRELRQQGGNPACVDACMTRCLQFGDLEELEQMYGPGLERELPSLPAATGTDPSLLIRRR